MSIDSKADINESPATIYRDVMSFVNNKIESTEERGNFKAIIDIHWFFLHSKYHKQNSNYKRHIGKWKYCATSYKDLIDKVYRVIPLVAQGTLPVVKFTNLGDVFSGQKMMIAYCFPFEPSPEEARDLLGNSIGEEIIWGSKKYEKMPLVRMRTFTALAIGIHNFPGGLATFFAALSEPAIGLAIAIAIAGITVLISLDELLPTARQYGKGHMAIYGLIGGMAVMTWSHLVLK